MTDKVRKERFLKELAKFLSDNFGGKSIELQVQAVAVRNKSWLAGRPTFALEWAALRDAAGLCGYESPEEAVEHLQKLLSS